MSLEFKMPSSYNHRLNLGRRDDDLYYQKIQAMQLISDISVVIIQRAYRNRIARLRAKNELYRRRMRLNDLKDKERIMNNLPVELISEVCTEVCINISIECFQLFADEVEKNQAIQTDLKVFLSDFIITVIDEELKSVVSECIRYLTALFMKHSQQQEILREVIVKNTVVPYVNPFVIVTEEVCNEVLKDWTLTVVKEAINDEVNGHLLRAHATMVLDDCILELFREDLRLLVNQAYEDVSVCEGVNEIVELVLIDESVAVATRSLGELIKQDELDMEAADLAVVAARLQEGVVAQMLISHLMLSMSQGFSDVMLEHMIRGIVKRMAADRLIKLVTAAERRLDHLRHPQNKVLRMAFLESTLQPIQDLLIESLISLSEEFENDIDRMEQSERTKR